jgi:hypothetical protein
MGYDAYLQGSYPNTTNIRGNSDVDVAVESDKVFYSNLTQEEKAQLGLGPAHFVWTDLRSEVLAALTSYYGQQFVDATGSKCIRVLPAAGRLQADVVPCIEYKHYTNLQPGAKGMTFWATRTNDQIINYPKLHIENGAAKNKRVGERYKPTVRVFKNARERLAEYVGGDFPSYFLECMLFNVPDDAFGASYGATFASVLNSWVAAFDSGTAAKYVSQSRQQWLFGGAPYQCDLGRANALVNSLVHLWNEW